MQDNKYDSYDFVKKGTGQCDECEECAATKCFGYWQYVNLKQRPVIIANLCDKCSESMRQNQFTISEG